jgi:Kelch motif
VSSSSAALAIERKSARAMSALSDSSVSSGCTTTSATSSSSSSGSNHNSASAGSSTSASCSSPKPLGDDSRKLGWKLSEPHRLRRPRSRHACIGHDGKLWIAGGCIDNNGSSNNNNNGNIDTVFSNSVDFFDPLVGVWEDGPPMLAKRDFPNLLAVSNELYVVGGDVDDEGRPITRTIERLDKDSGKWVFVTAFKGDRRGFSTSVYGSKILIFGGATSGDEQYHLNTWDAFDTTTGMWDSDTGGYSKMPRIDCWGQAVTVPPSDLTWS